MDRFRGSLACGSTFNFYNALRFVRTLFPVGFVFKPLGFQFGHFSQYIALFLLGLIASANNWLNTIAFKTGKQLAITALILLLFFPIFYIIQKKFYMPPGIAISTTNKLLALVDSDLIPYRKNDKWGFSNSSKELVIECIYDEVSQFSEELAIVKLNKKSGAINKKGEIVIPLVYSSLGKFVDNLAAAELDGKNGFINKYGDIIIPLFYDIVFNFSQGLACAVLNSKLGFIDKDGKAVVPFIYEADKCSELQKYSNKLVQIKLNGKWEFVDECGKIAVLIKYDGIIDFSEGTACCLTLHLI